MNSKGIVSDEYRLLDSGNCRKLEQAGKYKLVRPALNAFWKPSLSESEWKNADGVFERDSSGGGTWTWKNGKAPEEWHILWGKLELFAKPTQFGHLGFFAEQAPNWDWLRNCVKQMPGKSSTLNLFAYSGGATLAMASAGAEACHLDASKGIVEWARRNQSLNRETADKVRWICDDAMKFVAREQRRGNKYNGIVLDPPSFGRGAQGQVWKIENDITSLLASCKSIIDTEKPYFILLSCHSQGFSPVSLGRCLGEVFSRDAKFIESGEMLIPETGHGGAGDAVRHLPAGIYARIFKK